MNEKKTSSKESIGRLFKEKRYPIDRILQPVDNLLRNKPVSGVLLFLAVIIAMVWANSPWSESYHHLWETAFSVGFGEGHVISKDLHHWINCKLPQN